MTDNNFRQLIEESPVFISYEGFRQNIIRNSKNIQRLKIYFQQAEKYGIEYLRQNQNLTISDVNLIDCILNNKN